MHLFALRKATILCPQNAWMDEWRAGFTIYLYQFRVGGTRTIIKLFFFFFCDSKTILSGAAARPSIENWEIVLMDYSTYYIIACSFRIRY